jgi:hypothetical protein
MGKEPAWTNDELRQVVIIPHPRTPFAGSNIFPDIEFRCANIHLTYLEAKVAAPSRRDQFDNYIEALKGKRNSPYSNVSLVYATRFNAPAYVAPRDDIHVLRIKWRTLWEELENHLEDVSVGNRFLVKEFCDYLRWKGAEITDLEEGFREKGTELEAMRRLLDVAANRTGFNSKKANHHDHDDYSWDGLYLEDSQFTLGFRFGKPSELVFTTLNFRINTEHVPANDGEMIMWHSDKEDFNRKNLGIRWRKTLALDPGFFTASDNDKVNTLNRFLVECTEKARDFQGESS